MDNDFKYHERNDVDNSEIDDSYPMIKNAIIKIARKEGIVDYDVHKKIISADGGNCFGVLIEIDIKGKTKEGNNKEINIFVKQVIPNGDHIKLLSVTEIYDKEVFIYSELANIFNELQNKANIPMTERFKFVKIYDGSNTNAILLENMSKQGFKTYGRMDIMNVGYAKLTVEQLAKFHSLAFVIERNMPEYFERKIKTLKQSLPINSGYKLFANKIYKQATKKFTADLKLRTDEWWKTALDDYSKYMEGTMTSVKCLVHGDFKMNNVMYKEIEGKLADVAIVDYQLAHYGSPVLDLIYFICMGTEQEFRRKHMNNLKDYYHNALSKYLAYFDIHVDDVYSRKEFEKDFKDCVDYALVSAVCVLPFSLGDENGEPDLVDEIVHLGLKFNDVYYDRLKGVFEDFFKEDP